VAAEKWRGVDNPMAGRFQFDIDQDYLVLAGNDTATGVPRTSSCRVYKLSGAKKRIESLKKFSDLKKKIDKVIRFFLL